MRPENKYARMEDDPLLGHALRVNMMESTPSKGPYTPPPSAPKQSSTPGEYVKKHVPRKKAPNWMPEETATLLHTLIAERSRIENTKGSVEELEQARHDSWKRVFDQVNAISRYGRTMLGCQRKATHFVSEMRMKYFRLKKQVAHTGINPATLMKSHEQLALEYAGIEWNPESDEEDLANHNAHSSRTSDGTSTIPGQRDERGEEGHEPLEAEDYVSCQQQANPVIIVEEEEHEASQPESELQSHQAQPSFDDNDDDIVWQLPEGALETASSSESSSSCSETRPKKRRKSDESEIKGVGATKKVKKGFNTKNSGSSSTVDRAAALLRATKERSSKKVKAKERKKRRRKQLAKRQHQGKMAGRPSTVCCSCSQVFTDLLTRVVGVQEKLASIDEERTATIDQISHAITVLSCVVVSDTPQQTQAEVVTAPDPTPTDQTFPVSTVDGQLVSTIPSGSEVPVVSADGSLVTSVFVHEKTPPPLNLTVNKTPQQGPSASTETGETVVEVRSAEGTRPQVRNKRAKKRVPPASDRKLREKATSSDRK